MSDSQPEKPKRLIDQPMDRTAVSVGSFGDADDELAYWKKASIEQRLEGLEFMRQVAYPNYDPNTRRLPRFFEATRISRG